MPFAICGSNAIVRSFSTLSDCAQSLIDRRNLTRAIELSIFELSPCRVAVQTFDPLMNSAGASHTSLTVGTVEAISTV